MALTGKGYFIWRIPQCEKGDPEKIAQAASESGLSHILIKIADGGFPYNVDKDKRVDYVPNVVKALRARNISVWGWHYVYGNYAKQEAEIAISRMRQLKLDGYVVNAEGEYKIPGRSVNARIFMSTVRDGLGNLPIALSSFRYPQTHREFPWQAFVERCDLVMPQVYWMKSHGDAAEQLVRTVKEYRALFPHVTIFPTGPTFKEWGWTPYKEEVLEFMKTAKDLGLPGVNFYSFDQSRQTFHRDLYDVVKNFQWNEEAHPRGVADQLVDALNARNLESLLSLYKDDAIHICTDLVSKGKEALKNWAQKFVNTVAPIGKFVINSSKSQDEIIFLSWQLQHANTSILLNGQDTIMLNDGKISQHLSYYSAESFE